MRICVLSDEEKEDFDVSPYLKGFDYEFVTMRKPVMDVLKALKARNEFDIYLNVCEGYELDDEDENGYEAIEVVKALEELNLPFTGANSSLLTRPGRKCKPPLTHMALGLQRAIASSLRRRRKSL